MITKYRVWHKELKEMRTVVGLTNMGTTDIKVKVPGFALKEPFEQISYTWDFGDVILMEFTCRFASDGREIYEGDIIRWPVPIVHAKYDYAYLFGLVKRQYGGEWIVENIQNKDKCRLAELGRLEIEGNIYEHPHLLESASWGVLEEFPHG